MAGRYIALLRGINVGGNNIIKMVDLKACFEQMGFSDLATYIQSGNLAFNANRIDPNKIQISIEQHLSSTFNYHSPMVVLTLEKVVEIVNNTPKEFGAESTLYKYDVLFLKSPVTADVAITNIVWNEGVDNATAGDDVLYFSRLLTGDAKSYLEKIVKLPIYKQMTIRNWNMTTKLVSL